MIIFNYHSMGKQISKSINHFFQASQTITKKHIADKITDTKNTIQKLENEIYLSKNEIRSSQNKIERLNNRITTLETKRQQYNLNDATIEALQNTLEQSNNKLAQQMGSSNRSTNQVLQKEIDTMQNRFDILYQKNETLKTILNNKIEKLNNQIHASNNKIEKLDNKINKLTAGIKTLNNRIKMLTNKIKTLNNKIGTPRNIITTNLKYNPLQQTDSTIDSKIKNSLINKFRNKAGKAINQIEVSYNKLNELTSQDNTSVLNKRIDILSKQIAYEIDKVDSRVGTLSDSEVDIFNNKLIQLSKSMKKQKEMSNKFNVKMLIDELINKIKKVINQIEVSYNKLNELTSQDNTSVLNKRIDILSKQIAYEIDKVDSRIGTLSDSEVDTFNNKLTQLSKSIKKQKEMSNKFNVEILADELTNKINKFNDRDYVNTLSDSEINVLNNQIRHLYQTIETLNNQNNRIKIEKNRLNKNIKICTNMIHGFTDKIKKLKNNN